MGGVAGVLAAALATSLAALMVFVQPVRGKRRFERLKLAVRIVPCASDDFPVRARRPANSRFDTAKIRAALDHPIRPWQEALAEFLEGQ